MSGQPGAADAARTRDPSSGAPPPPGSVARPRTHWLPRAASVAALYLALGLLARHLSLPGYATSVWPPAGIALGALLLWGRAFAPAVWLGAFALNLVVAAGFGAALHTLTPWLNAASIALGATLQALAASGLTRRALASDPELLRPASSVRLLLMGGPLACLIGATWGVSTLLATGLLTAQEAPFSALTWWVGDTLGVLVFLPLFMVAVRGDQGIWARRRATVALPLLIAFGAIVGAFLVAAQLEQRRIANEFERQADEISGRLSTQLLRYTDAVAATRAFVAASQLVTREEFRLFASPLIARLPGIQALSWNPMVRGEEREQFEREAARLGQPDYRIRSWVEGGRWSDDVSKPEYVAVLHIEPRDANLDAVGLDIGSHPARRATIERAVRTGGAAMTERIALVTGRQAGVLLLDPAWRGDEVGQLRGVAVGVFGLEDILAPALESARPRWTRVRLEDRSVERAAELLAGFEVNGEGVRTRLTGASDASPPAGSYHTERCIEVGGRDWCLVFDAAPDFVAAHREWSAWAVLSSGMLFCGLLGVFLLILSGRVAQDGRRMLELASANAALTQEMAQRAQAEEALAREKELAEVTLHSIGEGVITTDVIGRIEYLNPVAERILEWTAQDAAGKQLEDVMSLVHEEDRTPIESPLRRCLAERRTVHLDADALLIARSGSSYAIQDSASPILTHEGRLLGAVMVFNDVTETRRLAREARHLATHDALTGLVNRRELELRLERALESHRHAGRQHVLCFIDLDRFKAVNDNAGHRAGDELLRQITRLLTRQVRERDTLARVGGDEFALLLDNCPLDKAVEIAEGMVAAVNGLRFVWEEQAHEVGASIGIAPMRQQRSVDQLLAQADAACYAAKDRGRGRCHVFEADDSAQADPGAGREVLRAADIRDAIDGGRLSLHTQPIVDLHRDGRPTVQHEVLVRLRSKSGQLLFPPAFMPAAERYRLMGGIDHWVINNAFEQFTARAWPEDIRLSINLSAAALGDHRLASELSRLIRSHAIDPTRVCFEIAETTAVRNLAAVGALMKPLRREGVEFALDEFGAGLSSLTGLKSLPLSYLKIAGVIANGVGAGQAERATVESIVLLARGLGARTVACRVESAESLQALAALGVDLAQGHAIGRPRPIVTRVIAT